jgi:hypothetical protein
MVGDLAGETKRDCSCDFLVFIFFSLSLQEKKIVNRFFFGKLISFFKE